MIKIKLGDVYSSIQAIEKLAQEQLSFNTLYKLDKLILALKPELEFIEKTKQTLFEKYGETTDNNQIKIKDEHIEDFNKEMIDLFTIEIELNVSKFKTEELSNLKMNYTEYKRLQEFLDI